ncbi:DUF6708 domain-containing protein [Achromobacter animicus]|uniref:DUF6708 domain-containing protein n=1 Tax=Achromobacter animicus TaxID=1389935 RepID=UPI0028A5F639|nr:DUF6708 domain-containing protein [Achromobacter animicus]
MKKPELSPPCSGWSADLPKPDVVQRIAPDLHIGRINHLDDTYLELSRPGIKKGILLWFGLLAGVSPVYVGSYVVSGWQDLSMLNVLAFAVLILPVSIWALFLFMKMELFLPNEEPIRFNRARQRIYAYNCRYRWWNPFERWGIVPATYEWSQVRAERWNKRAVTAQGALIMKWGVVLSIVEPGTNKVIDRFPLSTMGADEFAWAYVCTYMQEGPSVLSNPNPPRDHNDVPWYNFSLRLAPKVHWPAGMDLESRTRP